MIVSQTKIDPPPFEGESAAKLQKIQKNPAMIP